MRDAGWMYLSVTLIAAMLWLFAEAKSLGQYTERTEVRFVSGDTGARVVRVTDGFTGTAAVDMRAPQSSIARIRDRLGEGLRLAPGTPGVPLAAGAHTVSLLEVLSSARELRNLGMEVLSVRPQSVVIEITDLEMREVTITPMIDGVETTGEIRVTPPTARLRMPSDLWGDSNGEPKVLVILSAEQIAQLPASGPARVEADVRLSTEFSGRPFVELARQRVTLEFTIQNRNETHEFGTVPVMVVLPPIEMGQWRVTIHPEDQIVSASVTGPADVLASLSSEGSAIIGELLLSSEELEGQVTSKQIAFFLRQGDVVVGLPPSVDLTPSKTSVRFTVEKVEP